VAEREEGEKAASGEEKSLRRERKRFLKFLKKVIYSGQAIAFQRELRRNNLQTDYMEIGV
jgi:hypothetical protein